VPAIDGPFPESTLDPDDWSDVQRLGHQLLDDLFAYVATVDERPAWRALPDDVRRALARPVPREPEPLAEVLASVRRDILPYATGNLHPRFFGWVHGAGTVEGALADLVASFMNCNVGGREHAAVYVERQVLAWFAELFGLPAGTSGLLVSGTSMATIVALAVARESVDPGEVRRSGLRALDGPLVGYGSTTTHVSVGKAFELLGLGRDALRRIPVDTSGRLDAAALDDAIEADREAGRLPFCVVGTAGTVATGAIDDLDALAEVCARQRLWLHVDAAFGGALALSDRLRGRLAGIERADSLAFDLHKWMHVPYDAGCVLLRDAELHRDTFSADRDYLSRFKRGAGAGDPWFTDFGPELSRGFRALKVWVTLRAHGTERLARMVEKNCDQATWLGKRIESLDGWSLAAPVTANIVCFRPEPPDGHSMDPDRLTREVVVRVQESGVAVPSTAEIDGRLCVRCAIVNHRTSMEDLELLLEGLEEARLSALADA
jgi:aromatic-L-amino-acid decarboxylase